MSTPRKPVAIGEVLAGVLNRPKIQRGLDRARIVSEWEERVGDRIAAVSRVRSFHEGTLFVEVRSSAWLMELEMMKRTILERLNAGSERLHLNRLVFVLSETTDSTSQAGER